MTPPLETRVGTAPLTPQARAGDVTPLAEARDVERRQIERRRPRHGQEIDAR